MSTPRCASAAWSSRRLIRSTASSRRSARRSRWTARWGSRRRRRRHSASTPTPCSAASSNTPPCGSPSCAPPESWRDGGASRSRGRGESVKLAVLGAGNGGFATAADLALAGHRVRLWSRSADALGPLGERATITLDAEGRHGTAQLERATTDLREAVEGAEVLIVPLPATSHEDLAKRLAPCLNDRQIIRSEEHTSELQSRLHLVCRLLLEKKKNRTITTQ